MAKAELGIKRTCLSCNMRFYDFNRSPIVCPGCSVEFDPKSLMKKKQKDRRVPKAETKIEVSVIEFNTGAGGNTSDDMEFDDGDLDDRDGSGIIQDDIGEADELLPNLDEKED